MTVITYPPGPRSVIPGRALLAMRRDPLSFLTHIARNYGDIAHFKFGPQHVFLLNHPDLIKDVLVTHHRRFMKGRMIQEMKRLLGEGLLTSEGQFHLRQRRLAQPAFHRERIAAYAAVMVEYASRTSERWRHGATLDIAAEMMRLTLGVVGKTLFDADVEGEAEEIGRALTTAMEMADVLNVVFSGVLDKLPLPSTRRFNQAKARLDETIYRLIDEHRASGDRGDLLSMLLLASDEEDNGERMSNQQVRDEAITIFLAGHETTANALTWTWYLLSQHPEIEARLHAELDSVLGGRPPSLADLDRLSYTRMVLAESLRLYPPAYAIGRLAIEEYEAGPYTVPAGSTVLVSQWVMHHDPRSYADPLRFDPERWTPDEQAGRPKFAYFPFGGGPRICIGEQFAWMEGILVLATLAQRWRPRLVPGHPVEPLPRITLRAKYGMRMVLERR